MPAVEFTGGPADGEVREVEFLVSLLDLETAPDLRAAAGGPLAPRVCRYVLAPDRRSYLFAGWIRPVSDRR